MGKILIIKGADFSQNSISQTLLIEQGVINLIIGTMTGIYTTPETEPL